MIGDDPLVLHRALQIRRCPVCCILEPAEFDFMCQLQAPEGESLEARLKRGEAVRVCNVHLWRYHSVATDRGVGILLYAWLTGIPLEIGMDDQDFEQPCLICEFVKAKEQELITGLARSLIESEFRMRYAKSDGLCLGHFRKTMLQLREASAKEFLSNHQHQSLEKLRPLLEEIITKRFREASVSARSSVPRGIEKLVGRKGKACR